MSMNQPVAYDKPRANRGGVRAATHEYCPPATGYMEHISAMGIATARVSKLTPIKLKTITGGPPEVTPTMNTPLSAVHLRNLLDTHIFPCSDQGTHDVTTLKLKPIIDSNPNERLSS
jgi:hypothetical protein